MYSDFVVVTVIEAPLLVSIPVAESVKGCARRSCDVTLKVARVIERSFDG
jgi:hypothetical protein